MAPKYTRVATLDEARALTLDEMLALGLLPPIAGGAPDDDDDASAASATDAAATDDAADDDAAGDDNADAPADAASSEPNWKAMARKHEREAKKARKEREDLAKQLKEREDADRSEQEKAIDAARKDAVKDLESKFEKERRQDRLEAATARLAGRGLKVGSGDDAKTVRFADPDDALVYLERDIRNGDLDAEDIFDENGKVKSSALEEALADLLGRKPHLAAETKRKPSGSADAGKGTAANAEGSVADEFQKIRRHTPESGRARLAPGR